jgi:hypothetical protein
MRAIHLTLGPAPGCEDPETIRRERLDSLYCVDLVDEIPSDSIWSEADTEDRGERLYLAAIGALDDIARVWLTGGTVDDIRELLRQRGQSYECFGS